MSGAPAQPLRGAACAPARTLGETICTPYWCTGGEGSQCLAVLVCRPSCKESETFSLIFCLAGGAIGRRTQLVFYPASSQSYGHLMLLHGECRHSSHGEGQKHLPPGAAVEAAFPARSPSLPAVKDHFGSAQIEWETEVLMPWATEAMAAAALGLKPVWSSLAERRSAPSSTAHRIKTSPKDPTSLPPATRMRVSGC